MSTDDIPIAVLLVSRELSQAYEVGQGDRVAMKMLRDAAYNKDAALYRAIESAIRLGMGMPLTESNDGLHRP